MFNRRRKRLRLPSPSFVLTKKSVSSWTSVAHLGKNAGGDRLHFKNKFSFFSQPKKAWKYADSISSEPQNMFYNHDWVRVWVQHIRCVATHGGRQDWVTVTYKQTVLERTFNTVSCVRKTQDKRFTPRAGLEPRISRYPVGCSNHLSYLGHFNSMGVLYLSVRMCYNSNIPSSSPYSDLYTGI